MLCGTRQLWLERESNPGRPPGCRWWRRRRDWWGPIGWSEVSLRPFCFFSFTFFVQVSRICLNIYLYLACQLWKTKIENKFCTKLMLLVGFQKGVQRSDRLAHRHVVRHYNILSSKYCHQRVLTTSIALILLPTNTQVQSNSITT